MDISITILIVAIVIAVVAVITIWINKSKKHPEGENSMLLIQDQLNKLTDRLDDRLDKSQVQMRDSIEKQFRESSKLVTDVVERLAKLDETNKRVVDVADELRTLQNLLQNPKQRGVLGEYYLQNVLENFLPPNQFQMQYKFENGDIVDAVIYLDKNKVLPIDSKFSLENYNRLIEETDTGKRDELAKLFKQDLKNRIDETAKYIRPSESTMDFAFMFIPSEAIYYDLLINKVGVTQSSARDLIEYAFRDKHVIIVSPTSFMAYLQTIMQGLRSLKIEEQAKEIRVRVGQLGVHIGAFEQLMHKLGGALGITVNHYNNAHKELKKVDKDIIKISDTVSVVEPVLVDAPQKEE